MVRHVAVEEDLDGLFLLAGEFANLQTADMGGGFPIDVAGAFEGLVGARSRAAMEAPNIPQPAELDKELAELIETPHFDEPPPQVLAEANRIGRASCRGRA